MGVCLWDLYLDKYTGDGRSHGETFLGGLWIFFLGGGGGEEELQDTRTKRVSKQSLLSYISYVDQLGFSLQHVSDNREWCPRSSRPWTDKCEVQPSTTRRPVPYIEDSEGTPAPRSVTDSTEQWVWCFMHMRFMLQVISVICLD